MSKVLHLEPQVDDSTAESLRTLASQTGRTESELAADALEGYVAFETEFRRLVEEGRAEIYAGRALTREAVETQMSARRQLRCRVRE